MHDALDFVYYPAPFTGDFQNCSEKMFDPTWNSTHMGNFSDCRGAMLESCMATQLCPAPPPSSSSTSSLLLGQQQQQRAVSTGVGRAAAAALVDSCPLSFLNLVSDYEGGVPEGPGSFAGCGGSAAACLAAAGFDSSSPATARILQCAATDDDGLAALRQLEPHGVAVFNIGQGFPYVTVAGLEDAHGAPVDVTNAAASLLDVLCEAAEDPGLFSGTPPPACSPLLLELSLQMRWKMTAVKTAEDVGLNLTALLLPLWTALGRAVALEAFRNPDSAANVTLCPDCGGSNRSSSSSSRGTDDNHSPPAICETCLRLGNASFDNTTATSTVLARFVARAGYAPVLPDALERRGTGRFAEVLAKAMHATGQFPEINATDLSAHLVQVAPAAGAAAGATRR
jgi:hypothetical protein